MHKPKQLLFLTLKFLHCSMLTLFNEAPLTISNHSVFVKIPTIEILKLLKYTKWF